MAQIFPANIPITTGFAFLKKCVKSDGGIYIQDVPNYTTSICLMAFKDAFILNFAASLIMLKNF